ncbi:hypothetical protein EON80_22715 [bacterium]|nr:MAG: hypothetical protein EON80_22715 [bacterium]
MTVFFIYIQPFISRLQDEKHEAEANERKAMGRISSGIKMLDGKLMSTPDYNSTLWKENAKKFDKNKASAVALFAGATKVESFRLFTLTKETPHPYISNFPSYGEATTQGPDFAKRLGKIVLDAKTYRAPGQSTKSCYIEPAVGFRVWKGKQYADTVICFDCDQLAVLENDPKIPMNSIGSALRGRFYVAGDFDVAHDKLVKLAKEALPDDPTISKLKQS